MSNVVLVTGTSSGIGKETAQLFADRGWKVIATMRDPEKGAGLFENENIFVTGLDVQDKESINKAITAGIEKFGQIDVLINNAGYGQFGVFEGTTETSIRDQFEVNVFGVMNTIKAILPHFRERRQGTILNVSSGAGKFTLPLISLYAASKFALEGFSEALSHELSSLNILVKIVEPGGAATNFSAVSNQALSATVKINDYDPIIEAASKMFQNMRNFTLITGREVALLIFAAVTDGTDKLRYSIGNEDFEARMKARKELSDQEYVDFIRQGFRKYL